MNARRRWRVGLEHRYVGHLERAEHARAAACAALLGMGPRAFARHRRGRRGWDDDAPGFAFGDYTALAPGRFDPRVFDQDQVWVDMLRRPHRITDPNDLTDAHLLNVIAFLREEGWRWFEPDEVVLDVEQFRGRLDAWLDATPLMSALLAEVARRGLDT